MVEPYRPKGWEDVPAGLKDADGYWTTIHSGTLGLFVNSEALGGKPIPACWNDLLKPDYRGMVGYLDPSSAAVGYVGAVAVNLALGGSAQAQTYPDRPVKIIVAFGPVAGVLSLAQPTVTPPRTSASRR